MVTGKTVCPMDLLFALIQIRANMKATGKMECTMASAAKRLRMEPGFRVCLLTERRKATARKFYLTGLSSKELGMVRSLLEEK